MARIVIITLGIQVIQLKNCNGRILRQGVPIGNRFHVMFCILNPKICEQLLTGEKSKD